MNLLGTQTLRSFSLVGALVALGLSAWLLVSAEVQVPTVTPLVPVDNGASSVTTLTVTPTTEGQIPVNGTLARYSALANSSSAATIPLGVQVTGLVSGGAGASGSTSALTPTGVFVNGVRSGASASGASAAATPVQVPVIGIGSGSPATPSTAAIAATGVTVSGVPAQTTDPVTLDANGSASGATPTSASLVAYTSGSPSVTTAAGSTGTCAPQQATRSWTLPVRGGTASLQPAISPALPGLPGGSCGGSPSHRKVILIRGFGSQAFCGETEPSNGESWLGMSEIKDHLHQNPDVKDGNIQLTDENFVAFSYSDAYCTNDLSKPAYVFKDTCESIDGSGGLSDRLDAMITRLIDADPTVRIDVVAHSEGGIVASYWLATRGDDSYNGRARKSYVHSLVTLDSPVGGISPGLGAAALIECSHHNYAGTPGFFEYGAWADMQSVICH